MNFPSCYLKDGCLKLLGSILLVVCFATGVVAQERTVTGKVTGEGDDFGLPGVNILIKGTSNGTVTDFNGTYSIQVNEGDVLVFSFIGYKTVEQTVGAQSVMDIVLPADVTALEEIVVIGFGTTTEKERTAAVASLGTESIAKLNPPRLENALQGQISGVQISSQTGSPGGDQNIRIRGVNSNGDNRPLIIVDGIQFGDDLNAIDPNIIEDITVLKDASAAIYGVRGANGVIIITTKSGEGLSKPVLSVNGYYGIQEPERRIDMLNATEYAILTNEAFVAGGQTPPFTNIPPLGRGFDYQDEVFETTAPIQNYSLNYSGNTEKATYSVGASYFDQEGIVGGDKASFERVSVNLNSSRELIDNLKLTTNLNYINVNRRTLPENTIGSVLFNALNHDPTVNPVLPNGEFSQAPNMGIEIINPLAQIANEFNDTENNRFSGLIGLDYEVIEGLTVSSSYNFNFALTDFKEFFPEVDYGTDKVFNTTFSQVQESFQKDAFYNIDNIVRYETTINDFHDFTFMVGNTIFRTSGRQLEAFGQNIPNNSPDFAAIQNADTFDENGAASGFVFDVRQLSYFGRIEYAYQSKYLFSGLLRNDRSSNFDLDNNSGVFYALSAGWLFTEEDFVPSFDWLDYGKLRVSFGEIGNDRIPAGAFLPLLDGEAEYTFDGQSLTQGDATGATANPFVTWEGTRQFDLGIDLAFLNDKFSLTADYYIKDTRDLLVVGAPASGLTGVAAPGASGPTVNAGTVRNRGFELAVTYNETFFDELNFSASVNYANNYNEVTELNSETPVFAGSFGVGGANDISRFQVGDPIGAYLGLETNGLFQTPEEVASSAQASSAQPGDIRFVDQNNDGVIDDNDRVIIGSQIPRNIFGVSLSFDYKGFDLSTLWEAQTGHDLVRNYERNNPRVNRRDDWINRWTGPGTSNTIPRITTDPGDNILFSDFFVEDGDYLRIRNIQLGYTLPSEITEKIGSSQVRFYFSVNNVYTFTDYQGYDPSASRGISPGDEVGSDSALNGTNDQGFYPLARTYILGFNLKF
jgi:TonB-linked SusC/RagA family outer membrane protein